MELRPHAFDTTWSDQIASNYRSVITTAMIADGPAPALAARRLAVLTAHAHGAASLSVGALEVMLQRRLMQDDGLGMNEAMDEDAPFASPLWVLLESPDTGVLPRKQLGRQLDAASPVPPLVPVDAAAWAASGAATSIRGLAAPLPANVQLVTLQARLAASEANATAVVLRLAHVFQSGDDSDLSGPASLDLAALWAPPWQLRAATATGLTLGPVVFGAAEPLPAVRLTSLDLRTWQLDLSL